MAYAARDESGEEGLFYFIDAEGCSHFSNLPIELPEYPNTATKWKELPPGSHVRIKPHSKKAAKVQVVKSESSRSAVAIPAALFTSPKSVNPGIPEPLWQQPPGGYEDEEGVAREEQEQLGPDSSSSSIADELNPEEGTLFNLE